MGWLSSSRKSILVLWPPPEQLSGGTGLLATPAHTHPRSFGPPPPQPDQPLGGASPFKNQSQAAWTPCSRQPWFFTMGEGLEVLQRHRGCEGPRNKLFTGSWALEPLCSPSPLPNIKRKVQHEAQWTKEVLMITQQYRATGCEGSPTAGVQRWRASQPHTRCTSPRIMHASFWICGCSYRVPPSETRLVPSAATRIWGAEQQLQVTLKL